MKCHLILNFHEGDTWTVDTETHDTWTHDTGTQRHTLCGWTQSCVARSTEYTPPLPHSPLSLILLISPPPPPPPPPSFKPPPGLLLPPFSTICYLFKTSHPALASHDPPPETTPNPSCTHQLTVLLTGRHLQVYI